MSPGTADLKRKLMKRFYEVLVLLRVLGQVQGEKISGEIFEDGNVQATGSRDMRRKVMHSLCIMCDFMKGGDTVTAIATESLPSGPKYWVASNSNTKKIKLFLEETLEILELNAASIMRESETTNSERELFQKFVSFQKPRIKQYWKFLLPRIEDEIRRARSSPRSHGGIDDYIEWLYRFQHAFEDVEGLCELSRLAYDSRHSRFLRAAYDPVTDQAVINENEIRANIRHLVGRLCAPKRAAVLLAHAAAYHPEFFIGSTTCFQSPGAASDRPDAYAGLTLAGITGRMFSHDSAELAEFATGLQSLDERGSLLLRILDHYHSNNWRPRIHAELALLETLYDNGCSFYDDDKYISCSKPACFCCYHYICAHPGAFTHPPCHNKVYINWGPPKLTTGGNRRHLQQRDVMIKLTQQVRIAVTMKVLNAHRYKKWHPDSSTGITPSEVGKPDVGMLTTPEDGGLSPVLQDGSPPEYESGTFAESDESEDGEEGGVALFA